MKETHYKPKVSFYLSELFFSVLSIIISQLLKLWDVLVNKHASWTMLVDSIVLLLAMSFLLVTMMRRERRTAAAFIKKQITTR
jgi:hypothetical protein